MISKPCEVVSIYSGLYGVAAYIDLNMLISFRIIVMKSFSESKLLLNFQVPGPLCSSPRINLQDIGA